MQALIYEGPQEMVMRETDIPVAGVYEIIFHFPPNSNRAKNVPVTISINGGESKTMRVNEQEKTGQLCGEALG